MFPYSPRTLNTGQQVVDAPRIPGLNSEEEPRALNPKASGQWGNHQSCEVSQTMPWKDLRRTMTRPPLKGWRQLKKSRSSFKINCLRFIFRVQCGPGHLQGLVEGCDARISLDTMYSSISFRKSAPPQNLQLNILISNRRQ